MSRIHLLPFRQFSGNLALAAVTFALAICAHSQSWAADDSGTTGRIDFKSLKLPEATVEVDLSQDMFHDLFGIGDAAISGVAETLLKSTGNSDSAHSTKMAAEQLQAARQVVQLAGNVVHEVRVRVYDHFAKAGGDPQELFKAVSGQLEASKWETLVRVHDHDSIVRVAAIRGDGAIKGLFVIVNDHENVVLANVVCDVSQENVKKLTSTATKIGLDNGLAEQIAQQIKMKHMGGGKPKLMIQSKSGDRIEVMEKPEPPAPPKPVIETKNGVRIEVSETSEPPAAPKPPEPPVPPVPPVAPVEEK